MVWARLSDRAWTEAEGMKPACSSKVRLVPMFIDFCRSCFDGLAHEPRRHGVQLACVVTLNAPAGLEASIAVWPDPSVRP